MGFCSRCGEPCALAVCSCGGVAKTPAGHTVLCTGRSVTPDTDRWERRYVQRSPASTRKTLSRTLPEADNAGDNTLQSKRTKHLSLPTYAMAGHTFADVETLKQSDAGPINKHARDRIPSSKEFQEVEETISRAFGSVLDPVHQRQKWKCHDCDVTFLRDQTVYPDPRAKSDASLENALYCPQCFAGKFSLGVCVACGDIVLPDAATPFIQTKEKLWHAACYACLYCATDLSKSPQVDLYGNPCCATCFDNAAFLKDPTVALVPALLSASKPSSSENIAKQKKEDQRRNILMPMAAKMGPAVSELKSRLTAASLEKASPSLAPSPALTATRPHFNPQLGTSSFAPAQSHHALSGPTGTPVPTKTVSPSVTRGTPLSVPAPPFQAPSGSPRPPITSPRIAASKAFFDGNAGNGASSPPLASITAFRLSRPTANPVQTHPWQRHRPSQSMPVIPKHTNSSSGPSWLQSPILASTSAFPKPKAEAPQPVMRKMGADKSLPVLSGLHVAAGRVQRPLPAPPAPITNTIHQVKATAVPESAQAIVPACVSTDEIAQSAMAKNSPTSPKKMSAGILSRSKSFRKAEQTLEMSATIGVQVEGASSLASEASQASRIPFEKSSSASELAKIGPVKTRPAPQRAQTGLSRSNATFKARPPISEKRTNTAHCEAFKNDSSASGTPHNATLTSDARCSGCRLRLFSKRGPDSTTADHKIIVLPGTHVQYHARCFICDKCKKNFDDGKFVELDDGEKVHEKCAPSQTVTSTTLGDTSEASSMPMPSRPIQPDCNVLKPSRSASRLPQQYASAAQVAPMSPSKTQAKARPSYPGPAKLSKASEIFASREKALSSPVFGGMYACAGCGEEGTLAETTLGPVGTRFHHKCLKCVCGKQLDSGAKSYEEAGPSSRIERKFACRTCIDTKNLAKRSLSSMTGIAALRG